MSQSALIRPLGPADAAEVVALHDLVFGPGCHARTAYRIREGTPLFSRHCLGSFRERLLLAALRLTPITIGGGPGALLLGPLAVRPSVAGQGFGKALVAASIERAKAYGLELIVLVGDAPYYGRFGFEVVPAGRIGFPGPVNPARVLAVELVAGALERFSGPIAADRRAV
jgi:predicted N-acetyltransferase YhbS